jgi:hypothetical protein
MAFKKKLERETEGSVIACKRCSTEKHSHGMTMESENYTFQINTFKAPGTPARWAVHVHSATENEHYTFQMDIFMAPGMPASGAVRSTTESEHYTSQMNIFMAPGMPARGSTVNYCE